MIKLRPYQQNLADEVRQAYSMGNIVYAYNVATL